MLDEGNLIYVRNWGERWAEGPGSRRQHYALGCGKGGASLEGDDARLFGCWPNRLALKRRYSWKNAVSVAALDDHSMSGWKDI